jgi:hypothetical protein
VDRAYVRITDDSAIMPTAFVIDASASMAFPIPSLAKWRLAQLITLGLAFVATSQGDPIALAVAAHHTVRRPWQACRGVLADLTRVLNGIVPSGSAALGPVVDDTAGRTRGRLVVVSDFLGGHETVLTRARELTAAGIMVYAVHVVAREELSPPGHLAVVSDPEDPAVRRPLTRGTRATYVARFAEWRSTLRQAWRDAGASYALAVTDVPVAHMIHDIMSMHPSRT